MQLLVVNFAEGQAPSVTHCSCHIYTESHEYCNTGIAVSANVIALVLRVTT